MPELSMVSDQPASIQLGEVFEVQIIGAGPGLEIRFFLKHENVLYPSPFAPWETRTNLRVFPEAPGEFQIVAEWRTEDGSHGWLERSFAVRSGTARPDKRSQNSSNDGPTLVKLHDGTSVWSMSGWESGLLRHWESDVMKALANLVKPGFVVFDIGANVGVYSVFISNLVGPTGHVYCIEANPVCVYLLRSNLGNTVNRNFSIIPIAISDAPGSCRFKVNYGNSNLGLTEQSALFDLKMGQEIQVSSQDFDSMTDSLNLRPPDVIKIDIEGAEEYAIRGMRHTLLEHRPVLLLEIHGESAAGETFKLLDAIGYRLFSLDTPEGPPNDLNTVIELSRQGVFHLLARTVTPHSPK